MGTRKLIICRGIQGSGKSTWAKQWCHEDPKHRVRFNNDDIRNMLGDYWVPDREKLVTEAKANMITFALITGYDVAVDNMNLNPKEDTWIRTLCTNIEKDKGIHIDIEYKDFFIPVEECIRRDAMRPNPIGEKVIKDTWRRYRTFIIQQNINEMLSKRPEHVDGARPAILVDMDATLCLNTTGRPYYGEGAAEGMLNDIAVEGICNLVKSLYEKRTIFIITGREGTPEIIEATKKWLDSNSIKVDGLFFRPVKDYSPGAECKKKIYEDNIKGKYNVEFVLDDNYKCVEMWREQGLVCLQPNEGKF
jgi:predicted kinase